MPLPNTFALDRESDFPIFEQLCQILRSKMVAGELVEGTKLPATRPFATELGVSRSTVVTVYDQLVAEGYIQSKQGSGYIVCGIGEIERIALRKSTVFAGDQSTVPEGRLFQIGQPDMRLFPHRQWAKTVARICRTDPEAMLTGSGPFGNFNLREAVAEHVLVWRGIDASPHQIIVTAGSTDALEICIRTLTKSSDEIALEDPGYQPLRSIANVHGLTTVELSIDAQGAILPPKGSTPRLAVLTPSHQFPLGGAMSPSRRLAFKDWAAKWGSWVIEDDYDSEFRFAGHPIPAMASFGDDDRTIYVGSFSKIFSNALRIGYTIVPLELVSAFRATMTRFGLRASNMPQQALAEFINSGSFYRHLRRVRRIYGERRKFLADRIAHDFSDIGHFKNHHAGMHIVLSLLESYSDIDVAERAAYDGLFISALSSFASPNTGYNGLALGYCNSSEQELASGLLKLRKLICNT